MVRVGAAGLAVTLCFTTTGAALAQGADLAFVIAEPQLGSVSIVAGSDIIDVAAGLVRPVVVAADPASDRIVIGQAGPLDGSGSIIAVTPDGTRSTVAWGLPGIADLLVLPDGRVAYVTGVDGEVGIATTGQRPAPLVTTDGAAVGLALLDPARLLVVTSSGLGTLVAVENGEVLGVLPTSTVAPGRPAVLTEFAAVCVPDAARGEVNCAPFGDGAGFLVGGLAGVTALAPADPTQLLAVRPDLIALVDVPGGEVLGQWALAVADVDTLRPSSGWLAATATSRPLAPEPPPSPGRVQLWLLVLGVVAGVGAIAVAIVVRRDATTGRNGTATETKSG